MSIYRKQTSRTFLDKEGNPLPTDQNISPFQYGDIPDTFPLGIKFPTLPPLVTTTASFGSAGGWADNEGDNGSEATAPIPNPDGILSWTTTGQDDGVTGAFNSPPSTFRLVAVPGPAINSFSAECEITSLFLNFERISGVEQVTISVTGGVVNQLGGNATVSGDGTPIAVITSNAIGNQTAILELTGNITAFSIRSETGTISYRITDYTYQPKNESCGSKATLVDCEGNECPVLTDPVPTCGFCAELSASDPNADPFVIDQLVFTNFASGSHLDQSIDSAQVVTTFYNGDVVTTDLPPSLGSVTVLSLTPDQSECLGGGFKSVLTVTDCNGNSSQCAENFPAQWVMTLRDFIEVYAAQTTEPVVNTPISHGYNSRVKGQASPINTPLSELGEGSYLGWNGPDANTVGGDVNPFVEIPRSSMINPPLTIEAGTESSYLLGLWSHYAVAEHLPTGLWGANYDISENFGGNVGSIVMRSTPFLTSFDRTTGIATVPLQTLEAGLTDALAGMLADWTTLSAEIIRDPNGDTNGPILRTGTTNERGGDPVDLNFTQGAEDEVVDSADISFQVTNQNVANMLVQTGCKEGVYSYKIVAQSNQPPVGSTELVTFMVLGEFEIIKESPF